VSKGVRVCAGPLTPGAGIWVVDGRVYVAQVDLAHEAVDLEENVNDIETGWGEAEEPFTFSCREKLANLDCR
jgi:hypothetical protein